MDFHRCLQQIFTKQGLNFQSNQFLLKLNYFLIFRIVELYHLYVFSEITLLDKALQHLKQNFACYQLLLQPLKFIIFYSMILEILLQFILGLQSLFYSLRFLTSQKHRDYLIYNYFTRLFLPYHPHVPKKPLILFRQKQLLNLNYFIPLISY